MRRCKRCATEKPETEFWRNQRYPDGYQSVCKQCQREGLADNEPSMEDWDGRTTLSARPPLQSVYYAVCLQSGHQAGPWSLTKAQAAYVRFMGLRRCVQCSGYVYLQEDSDGLRGAGVQRHESPGKARNNGVQAA